MYSYYIECKKGERESVYYVYLEALKMFASFLERHVTPRGVYSTRILCGFEKLHRTL
jgi:hypothetical protein